MYTSLFNIGRTSINEEMQIVEICKYMGWDYNIYLFQPDWFIRLCQIRMREEALAQQREQRKIEAQSRRKTI